MDERAIDRIERKLPHYDRGKRRVRAFLTPGAEAIDELRDTFTRLRDIWYIRTAGGQALDNIAARWGLTRYADENDERLRWRIRRECHSALQSGTTDDIKRLLSEWLGWDPQAVRVYSNWSPTEEQEFPAFVEISIPISWLRPPETQDFRFSEHDEEPVYGSARGFDMAPFRLPIEPFLEYPVPAEDLVDKWGPSGVRFVFSVYGGFRFSIDPEASTYDSDYGFDAGKLVGILGRR